MQDFFNSIRDYVNDKAVSPLFGSFVVSWSIWNYKLVMIILSGEPLSAKFSGIDRYFRPITIDLYQWLESMPAWEVEIPGQLVHGLLIPSLIALFYIFVYPYISLPIYRFVLQKRNDLLREKLNASEQKPIDPRKARELHRKIAEQQQQINRLEDEHRERVDALMITLREAEEARDTTIEEFKANSEKSQDEKVEVAGQNYGEQTSGEFVASDTMPNVVLAHEDEENSIVNPLEKFSPDKSDKLGTFTEKASAIMDQYDKDVVYADGDTEKLNKAYVLADQKLRNLIRYASDSDSANEAIQEAFDHLDAENQRQFDDSSSRGAVALTEAEVKILRYLRGSSNRLVDIDEISKETNLSLPKTKQQARRLKSYALLDKYGSPEKYRITDLGLQVLGRFEN